MTLQVDIAIVGGGIAGVWLLDRLVSAGFNPILLETDGLGAGQTLKSQCIIHGGTKYTLKGVLTNAANVIASMPDRWRKCLDGQGEIDLTGAKVLSKHHYLWSTASLGSKMTTFFASKALRGRVDKLSPKAFPDAFQHKDFKGALYQLNEIVIDIPSVLDILLARHAERIFNYKTISITAQSPEKVSLQIDDAAIEVQRVVLTAGQGNAELIESLQLNQPDMQRRPLHMVMAKGKQLPSIYAHCIGTTATPRVTVTTHPTDDGEYVWYLGGEVAESGVKYEQAEQIARAKSEMKDILPWIDMDDLEWTTFFVDRAEPKQNDLTRPDNAFVQQVDQTYVCWPTKLTLAPDLADQVIQQLKSENIAPAFKSDCADITLATSQVAPAPWNDAKLWNKS